METTAPPQETGALSYEEELAKMQRGELYYAFQPGLLKLRTRCHHACNRFNQAGEVSRRELVRLWRDIRNDKTPLPAELEDEQADADQFDNDPWIDGPIKVDYGIFCHLGKGVYVNFNCVFLDTCPIVIGDRTLIGPNCSFYAATHPLSPSLRNGTNGPELGKPIVVGSDCWFGGSVTVLPGVKIGRGCTIGAGAVVTKNVPDFSVVAGNPARVIKTLEKEELPPDSMAELAASLGK